MRRSTKRKRKLTFFRKIKPPPNVPQAREIERFLALCKFKYSQRTEPAKNLNSFKRIWRNIAKSIAAESGKRIMEEAWKSLRNIGYKGIDDAMCDILNLGNYMVY